MIDHPWKTVFDSVCGTSHLSSGLPCQDACRVVCEARSDGSLLILTCGDGAGSAKHSELGSTLACDHILQLIGDALIYCSDINSIDIALVREWLRSIRSKITNAAEGLGVSPRELATTLMAGAISRNGAFFMQIGDGAVVVRRGDNFECVFWPQSGEYANTTNFVTDSTSDLTVQYVFLDEQINECALFTDGLERLALNFNNRTVHRPFLEPMLAALRKSEHSTDFFGPLRQFLDSGKINGRTDDDKTLILATRLRNDDCIL